MTIITPPEDFTPYSWVTPYGVLKLPDRRCLRCLSQWCFCGCNMCSLVQTLEDLAIKGVREMNEEWEIRLSKGEVKE